MSSLRTVTARRDGGPDWGRLVPASADDIAVVVGSYESSGGDAGGGGADVRRARARLQLLARFGALLEAAVPEGFEVSTCCVWQTATGPKLHPDVAVHRRVDTLGHLPAAPVLCVDLLPRRRPDMSTRSFARRGVDHYWQLDLERRRLKVYVRSGKEYTMPRRSAQRPAPGPTSGSD